MNKYILNPLITLFAGMVLLSCRMGGDTPPHTFPHLPLGACRGENEYPAKLTPSIYTESSDGPGITEEADFELVGNLLLDYETSTSTTDVNQKIFGAYTADDPQDQPLNEGLQLHSQFCAAGATQQFVGMKEPGDLNMKVMALSNCQANLNESTMILSFSADYIIQTRQQYDSNSTDHLKQGTLSFSCPYQLYDAHGDLIPESAQAANDKAQLIQ